MSELSCPIIDEELIEGDLNEVIQHIESASRLIADNRGRVDFTYRPVEKRTYNYPYGAFQ